MIRTETDLADLGGRDQPRPESTEMGDPFYNWRPRIDTDPYVFEAF